MKNDKGDELDSLIAEGLSTYSDAGPVAGLPERVMQQVRREGGRRKAVWPWRLAAAAAACLVAMLVSRPVEKEQRAVLSPPRPSRVEPVPVAVVKPAALRAVKRSATKKQRQFPAPVPLTDEERSLIAFVQANPEEAGRALPGSGPIKIEAIRIEPLEGGS